MKKTTLVSLLLFFSLVCFSQSQFGIFAGAQATSAKYTVADTKQPTNHKYGFQAGVGWKVPFETQLFFSPAAFYSLKGYKVNFNRPAYPPDTLATDNNTTIHTFELAFMLQLDLGKSPNHCFIKAGPSLDFQLKGREKFNRKTGGPVDRSMLYDFGAYGHYSANLIMQFGFETGGGFLVFAHCSNGFASINNADNGPRIFHRTYGISIGTYFNRKKIVLDTRNKE